MTMDNCRDISVRVTIIIAIFISFLLSGTFFNALAEEKRSEILTAFWGLKLNPFGPFNAGGIPIPPDMSEYANGAMFAASQRVDGSFSFVSRAQIAHQKYGLNSILMVQEIMFDENDCANGSTKSFRVRIKQNARELFRKAWKDPQDAELDKDVKAIMLPDEPYWQVPHAKSEHANCALFLKQTPKDIQADLEQAIQIIRAVTQRNGESLPVYIADPMFAIEQPDYINNLPPSINGVALNCYAVFGYAPGGYCSDQKLDLLQKKLRGFVDSAPGRVMMYTADGTVNTVPSRALDWLVTKRLQFWKREINFDLEKGKLGALFPFTFAQPERGNGAVRGIRYLPCAFGEIRRIMASVSTSHIPDSYWNIACRVVSDLQPPIWPYSAARSSGFTSTPLQSTNLINAVDDNETTIYNSETFALPGKPVVVELRNIRGTELSSLELVVEQTPRGVTEHEVHAVLETREVVPIAKFQKETYSGVKLTKILPTPLRNVYELRIITYKSPSHVAWRELRFFGR